MTFDDLWSRMSYWNLVLPPSRPDVVELDRIAAVLRHVPAGSRVGILGSTVEFRDLIHQNGGFDVYVFDRNVGYYEQMTRWRSVAGDETLVAGDWCTTLGDFGGTLTLLLSDLTSGNIEYERRDDFYRSIANVLAPAGIFIDKVLTNERPLIPLERIRRSYIEMPVNLQTVNYFSCEAIFCSEIQLDYQVIETDYVYDRLQEMAAGHQRLHAFIDQVKVITPPGCKWYYGKSWDELGASYGAGLTLLESLDVSSTQPYYGRARQYFWRKI